MEYDNFAYSEVDCVKVMYKNGAFSRENESTVKFALTKQNLWFKVRATEN